MTAQLKSGETMFRLPYGEDKPEAVYTDAEVRAMPRPLVDWNNDLFRVSELHAAGWTGKGIKVGIGDTGVQKDHPAFNGRMTWTKDYTGSPYGADDRNGHGTHCAGIIGAGRAASTGVGAAPDCTMGMAKVLGDGGSGGSFGIAQGIIDLTDAGFDIISLSLGSSQPDSRINQAIDYAWSKGVLVFAAAGNEGPNMNTVGWPGAHPTCIAVAAVDRNGGIAGFSSRGPQVDVAGYGVQVVSSLPGGGAGRMSGTSMACPAVAGLAACLLQRQRALGLPDDPATVRALIEKHVKVLTPSTSYGKGIFVPALALGDTPPSPPVPPSPPSPPVPPAPKPKVMKFVGQQDGFFGGRITGTITEVAAGSADEVGFTCYTAVHEPVECSGVTGRIDRVRKLLEFIRVIKLILDTLPLDAAPADDDTAVCLAVCEASGLSIDDLRKWVPLVIKYLGIAAPIILDGIAAGRKPLAIFLEVVAALSAAGVSP